MDLVLKLRELRRLRGLTQREAAQRAGVGVKTISSFETGDRIAAMTLVQLHKILGAYGVTEAQFFGKDVERAIAPWACEEQSELARLVEIVETLPSDVQHVVIQHLRTAVDVAHAALAPIRNAMKDGSARVERRTSLKGRGIM